MPRLFLCTIIKSKPTINRTLRELALLHLITHSFAPLHSGLLISHPLGAFLCPTSTKQSVCHYLITRKGEITITVAERSEPTDNAMRVTAPAGRDCRYLTSLAAPRSGAITITDCKRSAAVGHHEITNSSRRVRLSLSNITCSSTKWCDNNNRLQA